MHAHTLYITNPDATDLVEEMYPLIGNILGQGDQDGNSKRSLCINLHIILKNRLDGVNKIM